MTSNLNGKERNEKIVFDENLDRILMRIYSDGYDDGEEHDFLGLGNSPLDNARYDLIKLFKNVPDKFLEEEDEL